MTMPGVDQILSAVVQQGANELRLGTDQAPIVLAAGTTRRFTMSPTPDSVLRHLLGELLTPERETELELKRECSFEHEVGGVGRFQVTLSARKGAGMDASFLLAATRPKPRATRQPGPFSAAETPASPKPEVSGMESLVSPPDPELHCTEALSAIIERAIIARASDVHLADDQTPYFRIDGRLQAVSGCHDATVRHLFELAPQVNDRIHSGQALEVSLDLPAQRRIRVSLYRMDAGLAAAIRLLPNLAPVLRELNLPIPLQDLAELSHGLVLFCGATGSGKSSTLAALCRHALEQRSVLLVTLEDPVEFLLQPTAQSIVRQRQIGRDVGDVCTGLRDALRSDPDIIMVGELRDAKSIRLALTAAETGHLVLASLHSGSAASCLERVVDAYAAEQRAQIRTQLAEALRAVVVQRLIPRMHGQGRVPALEVLRVTHGVANVIREGKTAQVGTMLQGGKRDGMISLERCLAEYVEAGAISLEHATAAANDADSLRMYLSK